MRTGYRKPKLPAYLSFPLGLEAIASALCMAAQLPSLAIIFSANPIHSATRFRQLLESEAPHAVLSARFIRWDKKPSIGNDTGVKDYLNGRWSLWVFPVRRDRKAKAKNVLV